MELLPVGTSIPDFALPNQDGKIVKLADLRHKYIIIYFYPKALTPGCTTQACGLRDIQQELADHGAIVLGISADEPSLLKKFKEKEGLNFDLLGDEGHQLLEKFGVWVEKSMYGRKYWGVARATFIINNEHVICKVWPKVDPASHATEILAWLQEQK